MSKRTLRSDIGRYAMCPLWILSSGVSDRAIRLFALLAAQYADRDTDSAYPERSTLARALQCSTSSIDRALKQLARSGSLTIERRFKPSGEPTSNRLTLHFSRPKGVPSGEESSTVMTPIVSDDERSNCSYPDKNVQTNTAQRALDSGRVLRPVSVWNRGLAISHRVIEDFPENEENWPHALKSRMLNQDIDPYDRGPKGDKQMFFMRVLEACIEQRKHRKGDGGVLAWRHRQRDRDFNKLKAPRTIK